MVVTSNIIATLSLITLVWSKVHRHTDIKLKLPRAMEDIYQATNIETSLFTTRQVDLLVLP